MLRGAFADEDEEATTSSATSQLQQKKLHTSSTPFNFNDDCFICGDKLVDSNARKHIETRHALTKEIRETILKLCAGQNDEQKVAVRDRVKNCPDLKDVNAQYHLPCYALLKKTI